MKNNLRNVIAHVLMVTLIIQNLLVVNVVAAGESGIVAGINAKNELSSTNVKVNEEFTIEYTYEPQAFRASEGTSELVPRDKEVVIVLDTSGSMNRKLNNKKTRIDAAKASAKSFITKLHETGESIRVSLIDYNAYADQHKNSDGEVLVDVSKDENYKFLIDTIDNLNADDGTNIGDGLRRSFYNLANSGNGEAEKYVVLMTDGEPTAFTASSLGYTNKAYYSWLFGKWLDLNAYYYENLDENLIDKDEPLPVDKENFVTALTNEPVYFSYDDGFSENIFVNIGDNDLGNKAYEYAYEMAKMIGDKSDTPYIDSYYIGFTEGAGVDTLKSLGTVSGGTYKKAIDDTALETVYDEIFDEIINKEYVLKDVKLEETFPEGFTVIDLPDELEFVGQTLRTKEGQDVKVKYHLNTAGQYVADPITYTVTVTADDVGTFALGTKEKAFFRYNDFDGKDQKAYFTETEISVVGHGPKITLLNPKKDTTINRNKQLYVNFVVNDLDDDYSKVQVVLDGEIVYHNYEHKNGEELPKIYKLSEEQVKDGVVHLKIIAEDGYYKDEVEKDVPVLIGKTISKVNRTITPDTWIESGVKQSFVGEENVINYTFEGEPQDFTSLTEIPKEIVLVLNTSMTMSGYVKSNGKGELQKAAMEFVDTIKGKNVSVGVVGYTQYGYEISKMRSLDNSKNINAINKEIKRIKNVTGTNLGEGIRYAYQMLNNGTDADKRIVILSDGMANTAIAHKSSEGHYENWQVENLKAGNDIFNSTIDDSINKDIRYNRGDLVKIGLVGVKTYRDTNVNGDYFAADTAGNREPYLDRFNIGHNYVTKITEKINATDLNYKAHMIHFTRVSGAGTDEDARNNNNEVAALLGIPKDEKTGNRFTVVANKSELVMTFKNVAEEIEESASIPFEFEFEDYLPEGVEPVDYLKTGLSYDASTRRLYGTVQTQLDRQDDGTYILSEDLRKEGFSIAVKNISIGLKAYNRGEVNYKEPYDDEEVTLPIADDEMNAVPRGVAIKKVNRRFVMSANTGKSGTYYVSDYNKEKEAKPADNPNAMYDEITIVYDFNSADNDKVYVNSTDEYVPFFDTLTFTETMPKDLIYVKSSSDVTVNPAFVAGNPVTIEITDFQNGTTQEALKNSAVRMKKVSGETNMYQVEGSFELTFIVKKLQFGKYHFNDPDKEVHFKDIYGTEEDVDIAPGTINLILTDDQLPKLL